MAKSSETTRARKPKKQDKPDAPYDGFPLYAHASGRWAKKVNKKTRFYGRWGTMVAGMIVWADDIDATARKAKAEFDRCWMYHSQGREAPPTDAGEYVTLEDLANKYLEFKENRVGKELSLYTFTECHRTCEMLIEHFGKGRRVDSIGPDDFEALRKAMGKGVKLVTLKSKINRARGVFNYAYDSRLIDRPIEYGVSFDMPKPKSLRAEKNATVGENMFEREELLLILDALSGKSIKVDDKIVAWPESATMRAMVLLGLNAGMGNTDCSSVPKSAFKLDEGWLVFPRPKSGIHRRVPLWPETVAAVRKAIAERPNPIDPEDAGLCFLTERGTRFMRIQPSKADENRHVAINGLSRRFEQLLNALNVGQRARVNFYTLRHVFETIAGGSRDQVAVDSIMGHVDPSMASEYRERIDDDRLRDVVQYVHDWLWPLVKKTARKTK